MLHTPRQKKARQVLKLQRWPALQYRWACALLEILVDLARCRLLVTIALWPAATPDVGRWRGVSIVVHLRNRELLGSHDIAAAISWRGCTPARAMELPPWSGPPQQVRPPHELSWCRVCQVHHHDDLELIIKNAAALLPLEAAASCHPCLPCLPTPGLRM